MNPFTVILAQKYADLPLLSGMGFRMGVWLVMMSLCVWWILRYAKKVRKDPTQSVMYGVDVGDDDHILTLSTCTVQYGVDNHNYRFVVMGRLLGQDDPEPEKTAITVKGA